MQERVESDQLPSPHFVPVAAESHHPHANAPHQPAPHQPAPHMLAPQPLAHDTRHSSSLHPDSRTPAAPARIAFLNRCYWPDQEATGQLLEELASHLANQYDVTVVAGQPNASADSGYRKRKGREIHNGVRIERLSHTTFHKRSIAGRLMNLASFTWKAYLWGRKAPQFDVIISETDPFFLPLVAAPLAKRTGAKYIAYLQDVYPDIGIELGIKSESVATRKLRERLKRAYMAADRLIVLDEDMRERLVGWGLPREKFVIIPNWIDTELVRPTRPNNPFRQAQGLNDRFVVMHSGNMGLSQRLDVLVSAAARSDWPEQAILMMVGGGARNDELQKQARQLGLGEDRIRFLKYQPKEKLGESLSSADLQVVSMDGRIRGCLSPSKLYGILASGTPALAVVPEGGAVQRVIEEHRVGFCSVPNDSAAVAAGVRQAMSEAHLLPEYGQRARDLAVAQYDRAHACAKFDALLAELLEPAGMPLSPRPLPQSTSPAPDFAQV